MKRPLSVAGFTMLGTLVLLCCFDSYALSLALGCAIALLFVVSLFFVRSFRRAAAVPLILAFAVLSCVLFCHADSAYRSTSSLAGRYTHVKAVVNSSPKFNKDYERYYCSAKIVLIDGKKYQGNIRISFSEAKDEMDSSALRPGNILTFDGFLYQVGGKNSDISDYFKTDQVFIGAYAVKNLHITEAPVRPLTYYCENIRRTINMGLLRDYGMKCASVMISLVTGDKSYLSDTVYDQFKRAGAAHLMAVSGLHLSVLLMFLTFLLRKKGKRLNTPTYLFFCLFVVFMMFLSQFSGSVTRAGIMMLFMLTGERFGESADSLNSLGFSCMVILLVNPFSAMDVGFLLSVLSTYGILVMAVPVNAAAAERLGFDRKDKWYIPFLADGIYSLSISLAVYMYTLPVIAVSFGEISKVGWLTNLILLPVSAFLVIIAAISALLSAFGLLPGFVAALFRLFVEFALKVTEFFGGENSVIHVRSQGQVAFFCLLPFLLFCAYEFIGKKIWRRFRLPQKMEEIE